MDSESGDEKDDELMCVTSDDTWDWWSRGSQSSFQSWFHDA